MHILPSQVILYSWFFKLFSLMHFACCSKFWQNVKYLFNYQHIFYRTMYNSIHSSEFLGFQVPRHCPVFPEGTLYFTLFCDVTDWLGMLSFRCRMLLVITNSAVSCVVYICLNRVKVAWFNCASQRFVTVTAWIGTKSSEALLPGISETICKSLLYIWSDITIYCHNAIAVLWI